MNGSEKSVEDEFARVAETSARGGFFLIFGTALSTLVLAIGSMLIGRLLGPELYGQYALVLIVPQILFLFADLGINEGIVKFCASYRANGEEKNAEIIIQSGIIFRALAGSAISVVNFLVADIYAANINRPDIGPYIKLASASIIFQAIFTTVIYAFIGLDKTEYNGLMKTLQAIVKTLVSISLILFGFGVAGAIVGYVSSFIIAAIISTFLLFLKLFKPIKNMDKRDFPQNIKTLAIYGIPLYISMLLTGFVPLLKNFILAYFTTDVELGNFRAATEFNVAISVVTVSITTTLLQAFSKLDSLGSGRIRVFFNIANKYISLLIVPVVTLILIFSKEIVMVIYGHAYETASLYLSINCLLYFLVPTGYLILSSLFNGVGDTRSTLKITLINFLSFIILGPILAKAYSIPGMIVAFLASNTIATLYARHKASVSLRIDFNTNTIMKIYIISAISSIPPICLVYISSFSELINMIAGGSLFLLTYATLIPISGVVTYEELQSVKGIIHNVPMLKIIDATMLTYQQKLLDTKNNRKQS